MNKIAFIDGYMEKTALVSAIRAFRQGKLKMDDLIKLMEKGFLKPRQLAKIKGQKPGKQLRAVVHQGASSFDPVKFKPVKNIEGLGIKPEKGTGLWTTPGGTKDKHWVDAWAEDIRGTGGVPRNQLGYVAQLKPGARVATINNLDDLKELVKKYPKIDSYDGKAKFMDYEKMADDYDIIHLTSDGQRRTRGADMDYKFDDPNLYGWDIESTLVLNPEAVNLPKGRAVTSQTKPTPPRPARYG